MPPLTKEEEEYLRSIYFDPAHPASYQSPLRLYIFVKNDGQFSITLKQIKDWLQTQEAYSLNRNVLRNFQRGRVLVTGIDDQWEADLADLQDYASENDGYKYLLFVIDVFSRFAWVKPLKSKEAKNIIAAFKEILENEGHRHPKRLRTDAGRDFTSAKFQQLMKSENINHFVTHSEKQANYVERLIQTIKRKLFRHIVHHNNPRYIDDLPSLVDSYNKTFHSGIKSEPYKVTETNERQLWWQMYWPKKPYKSRPGKRGGRKVKFAFKIGDKVRISYIRTAFVREYSARWSREIFKVSDRFPRQKQPLYKLVDWEGDPVEGTFYEKELQKTLEPPVWKIEKIIKYKGRRPRRQVLVGWKGWPKKFNSWIAEAELKRL
jgi:hypothetical protein